jgi:hypothetical protein
MRAEAGVCGDGAHAHPQPGAREEGEAGGEGEQPRQKLEDGDERVRLDRELLRHRREQKLEAHAARRAAQRLRPQRRAQV